MSPDPGSDRYDFLKQITILAISRPEIVVSSRSLRRYRFSIQTSSSSSTVKRVMGELLKTFKDYMQAYSLMLDYRMKRTVGVKKM